jgi:hypothetical protein
MAREVFGGLLKRELVLDELRQRRGKAAAHAILDVDALVRGAQVVRRRPCRIAEDGKGHAVLILDVASARRDPERKGNRGRRAGVAATFPRVAASLTSASLASASLASTSDASAAAVGRVAAAAVGRVAAAAVGRVVVARRAGSLATSDGDRENRAEETGEERGTKKNAFDVHA